MTNTYSTYGIFFTSKVDNYISWYTISYFYYLCFLNLWNDQRDLQKYLMRSKL